MKNRFFMLIVLLTFCVSHGISQDFELEGDTTTLRLIDESGKQRILMIVKNGNASVSVWDTDGKELAVLGSSIGQIASNGEPAQGAYGVLSLSNDTGDNSIIAVGASAIDGTPALLSIKGDSAFLKLRTPTSSEALELFARGSKSGIVLSDPDGNSVAQLITATDGKSGIFALDNDNQTTTILARGGSDEIGTDPLIRMKGDFTEFVMEQEGEIERVRLFVDDLKSGVVVFNPVGESVAQLTTNPDGENGILALENDNQVPTIFATGGSTFDNIPPAIRIEGETTKLDFVGDTLSNLSIELNKGEPLVSMFSKSGDRLVELGMVPFAFNTKDNVFKLYDRDSIFFSLRNDGLCTDMNLDNGRIGLYSQFFNEPYMLLEKDEIGGTLALSKLDNTDMIKLSAGTGNGYGSIGLFGANGSLNILATEPVGADNHGALSILNELGAAKIKMVSTLEGNGEVVINGANGNNNILLAELNDANRAYLHLANTAGAGRAGGYISAEEKGVLFAEQYSLINPSNSEVAKMFINGSGNSEVNAHTISATVKSFKMDHPSQAGKEIWYASIEGPEAAAYVRGTGTLSNGKATIYLPDYFSEIVEIQGLTVLLTPLSGTSKGMAVISKNVDQFSVVELLEGAGSYEFDWEVKGIRSGLENFEVIRDKPKKLKSGIQNILSERTDTYYQKRNK